MFYLDRDRRDVLEHQHGGGEGGGLEGGVGVVGVERLGERLGADHGWLVWLVELRWLSVW